MGSQIGLFVVSSMGAKYAAFHSEDETQKAGCRGCDPTELKKPEFLSD